MKTKTFKTENGDITIESLIQVVFYKKRFNWIAIIPSLKVLGYSNDGSDAVKDAIKNANIFFDVHLKGNTLEIALKEFGWELIDGVWNKPKRSSIDSNLTCTIWMQEL